MGDIQSITHAGHALLEQLCCRRKWGEPDIQNGCSDEHEEEIDWPVSGWDQQEFTVQEYVVGDEMPSAVGGVTRPMFLGNPSALRMVLGEPQRKRAREGNT